MSLLLVFCVIFFTAVFLEIGPLAAFMAVVWLYSFFDSYNLRARINEDAYPEDAFLFGLSGLDHERLEQLLSRRHSIIGWVLVVLGIYGFYPIAARWFGDFMGRFFDSWWLNGLLLRGVPRLAVTALIIALGVWFIRGPKGKRPAEDIPAFTPPAAGAAQSGADAPDAPEDGGTTPAGNAAAADDGEEAPHDQRA